MCAYLQGLVQLYMGQTHDGQDTVMPLLTGTIHSVKLQSGQACQGCQPLLQAHTLMRDNAALKSTLGPSTMMQSHTRAVVSEGRAVVNIRLNHSPVRPARVHSSRSKTSSRRGCLRSTSTSNMRCSTLLPDTPYNDSSAIAWMCVRQLKLIYSWKVCNTDPVNMMYGSCC